MVFPLSLQVHSPPSPLAPLLLLLLLHRLCRIDSPAIGNVREGGREGERGAVIVPPSLSREVGADVSLEMAAALVEVDLDEPRNGVFEEEEDPPASLLLREGEGAEEGEGVNGSVEMEQEGGVRYKVRCGVGAWQWCGGVAAVWGRGSDVGVWQWCGGVAVV